MPKQITVNVHDDIPDALRDALVSQLERRAAPIVGNLADLNRLGSNTVAESGPDETFRLNPAVDEEQAKPGAQRAKDEVETAAAGFPDPGPGPDEDPADKDPVELDRDGKVTTSRSTKSDSASASVGTQATGLAATAGARRGGTR